ncbi:MAG: carbonic anhydrase [Ignavibacteria bacterium]|nr:carbonic anhydrase [Ignavibacteria bacterium]
MNTKRMIEFGLVRTACLILTFALLNVFPAKSQHSEKPPKTIEKAGSQHAKTKGKDGKKLELLNPLKTGNYNFMKGLPDKHDFKKEREKLVKGQSPSTIIITCSDSRVPPEIIFDKGLGQIFVIRNAGNVVDSVVLGSAEYAAEHLHSKVLIVMGHKSCGAIKASLEGETPSPYINSIIAYIKPAVASAKAFHLNEEETVDVCIEENVKNQMKNVMKSKIITHLIEEGELDIYGAVYDLATGEVKFLMTK